MNVLKVIVLILCIVILILLIVKIFINLYRIFNENGISPDTKMCFDCDLHFNPVDGYIFSYCPMCGKKLYGFDEESIRRFDKDFEHACSFAESEINFYNKLTFEEKVRLISLFRYGIKLYKDINYYGHYIEDVVYSMEFYKELTFDDVEFLEKLGFKFKEVKNYFDC